MDPRKLCNAIRRRRVVRFVYHAEQRTVHPHALFASKEGNVLLSGTEPPAKGWRAYHLDEISGLEILDKTFTPDAQFEPDSPTYHRLLCSAPRD